MNMTIRVDIGDGPQDIQTNLWAVVAWERKYKTKASHMATAAGMEDLAYLAYESMRQQKITVPAVFDDFIKKIVSLEVIGSDERPTQGEPDDAS